VTSHAERTSPVLRGKWILENILGLPVPPPPPNVPPLKERANGEKPRTMREQMAEHRADPACASCHKIMDSIGFALENFDAVGTWRSMDAEAPVDASGDLADGTHVNGVVELRAALLKKPDLFVGTMTEKIDDLRPRTWYRLSRYARCSNHRPGPLALMDISFQVWSWAWFAACHFK